MVKIVRKKENTPLQNRALRVGSVLVALLASMAFIAALGYNPFVVFGNIVSGSVGSAHRFQETVNKAIPLVVLSLGIAVAFRLKFVNIGAEGQFYLGAMAATYVALEYASWPAYLLIPFMMLSAALAGGLWCLFPALLKFRFGTSETLVTLMLNYIAVKIVSYLQYGPWKDPKAFGFARIATFSDNAVLPRVFGVHIGWIFALVLAGAVSLLLGRSKLGYEIAVLGENERTAKYAGMNTLKILLVSVLVSGGLCGLAGMIQASAIERSLTDQLSGGMGYTAIITAWLANLSAPATLFVSFFFAVLLQGSTYIQSSMQIPAAVAEILQGIVIFFVLGSEFFTKYRFVISRRAGKEEKKA